MTWGRGGCRSIPTKTTGNPWERPMYNSGRPTADLMMMMTMMMAIVDVTEFDVLISNR